MPLDEPHDSPDDWETPTDLTVEKPVAPSAAAASAAVQPRRLTFLPAFRYVFENPDWLVTVVLASVCYFIPVLGQVALLGFFYEVVEGLYRRPDCVYAKFDFNRFGVYCTRGVWPYVLLQMVVTTLQVILQLPVQFGFQGLMILGLTGSQVGAIVAAIGLALGILFLLALALCTSVLTSPMLLRAGMTQDFRQVFRFDWFKGYLKRVWVEEVLAFLFVSVSSAILLPLGCALLCVGFFAASTVILIAGAHWRWQIYEIYLERGGEPIPLQPLPAQEPPALAKAGLNETEGNQAGTRTEANEGNAGGGNEDEERGG